MKSKSNEKTDSGQDKTAALEALAELVIRETAKQLAIEEGKVLTAREAPYRRLDCDGRALAYVRVRSRKRAVRVDISALWNCPESPIAEPGGTGLTILVEDEKKAREAVRYLHEVVRHTRAVRKDRAARKQETAA